MRKFGINENSKYVDLMSRKFESSQSLKLYKQCQVSMAS